MNIGRLYIVATPIGNLSDISQRAIDILKTVTVIAAEDTRHSRKLLSSIGASASTISLHDHNERTRSAELVEILRGGGDIALISDAGTPMISDPGFHLIRAAQDAGIPVIPIPGPSAVVAALSVSGLPANRFCFYGFLPERQSARQATLLELSGQPETMAFYESGRRLKACLEDVVAIMGEDREAVICKELTKIHELTRRDTVGSLLTAINEGNLDQRGEFVILLAGTKVAKQDSEQSLQIARNLLLELGDNMPLGQASSAISKALGCSRKQVYELGLRLKQQQG